METSDTGDISQFNNPRYPKNREYYPRYIDLGKIARNFSERQKRKHIANILQRKSEVTTGIPKILGLLYTLRLYCILLAYFPTTTHRNFYDNLIEHHEGWGDFMTKKEERILRQFKKAMEDLKSRCTNTTQFEVADKIFDRYKYDRWISSLGESQ